MESPIIALPYWITERVSVSGLTANSLSELENSLSDEELIWMLSLHKLQPFQGVLTELGELQDSERIRNLSAYELSDSGVEHSCNRYLRSPEGTTLKNHLTVKLCTTPNLHIMLLAFTNATVNPIKDLAKQYCDNTSFSQMCHVADGMLLTKYIN